MFICFSFISAITILGTPSEMYVFGTQYWMIGFSYPFVLAATAHLYLPVYHELQLPSVHEYLELRFNRAVRIFASLSWIILTCLYLAIVVYAPSLALAQVTGIEENLSILITFLVCIAYTAMGGIKAVIWTTVFQAFCMLISSLVVVIVGENAVGGSATVFEKSFDSGRIELFNFDMSILTRHSFWSQVIGGYFTWMTIYGINQTMIQRYLTVATARTAKKAIWLSGIAITVILSVVAYAGLVIYARYEKCDPVKSNLVSTKDQLLPLFVMDLRSSNLLTKGFPGFFVAGVFSGALSTVSGGLNSLAAVTLEDFVKLFICTGEPGKRATLSDENATKLSKALAIAYGVFSYILIFLVKNIPGLVQAWLGIFGIFGGPVLGLFSLGMFIPWATSLGAMIGGSISLVFMLWVSIGGNMSRLSGQIFYEQKTVSISGCPANLNVTSSSHASDETLSWWFHLDVYEISYMWYSGVACTIVIIIGCIVSAVQALIIEKDKRGSNVDQKLLSPAVEILFACWPRKIRDYLAGKRLLSSRSRERRFSEEESGIHLDERDETGEKFLRNQ